MGVRFILVTWRSNFHVLKTYMDIKTSEKLSWTSGGVVVKLLLLLFFVAQYYHLAHAYLLFRVIVTE